VRRLAPGFFHRRVAGSRQRVQTAAGPVLASSNRVGFPPTLEEAHVLEAAERAIQRPEGGHQRRIWMATEHFSEFVSVKRVGATVAQLDGGFEYGELQRNEVTRPPAHGVTIRTYVRLVKICHG
jgi:hypothetical protein